MRISRTIGLVLVALLSVAALASFLVQGGWSEKLLALVCAACPAALYLMAPGRSGRPGAVFPLLLGIMLLAGLFGVFSYSAAGRGADGLVWLILSLWLLPLILVSAFHAVFDRDDRLDLDLEELERRFGRREGDR